jgi:hypothetical protein
LSERFRGLVGQDHDRPLSDQIREFADMADYMHPGQFQGWTEVWRGWAYRIDTERPPALDVETFIAGLDSANHSSESRRAWIDLFYRDMKNVAKGRV